MLDSTEQIIHSELQHHAFRDEDLAVLFGGSPARRYGLVNKALKSGELIQIRRGLYILGPKYHSTGFSKYYLANHIVPYSYVTAESALSFYGWIPERVTQITSASAFGRNKQFCTPLGDFCYWAPKKINLNHFFSGVDYIQLNASQYSWIATPLRALIDYVSWHKVNKPDLKFLHESLRIEVDHLKTIMHANITQLMSVYDSNRVTQFLKNLSAGKKHE